MEKWIDIVGFEGIYKVSNLGNVISNERYIRNSNGSYIIRDRLLSKTLGKTGYIYVMLCKNGTRKNKTLHRIMAIAFIPNPDNKPHINHINGIKHDYRLENLEWCTAKENSKHSFESGLMDNSKRKAAIRMSQIGKKYSEINSLRLRNLNKLACKKIEQRDLEWNFIKTWDSINDAELHTKSWNIHKVLHGKASQSGGFRWKLAI